MQLTDNREISALGSLLASGLAQIRGEEDGFWIVASDQGARVDSIPVCLRPSWRRYMPKGPRGRPKGSSGPKCRLVLYLPEPLAARIPTPRQAWVRGVIQDRLMQPNGGNLCA